MCTEASVWKSIVPENEKERKGKQEEEGGLKRTVRKTKKQENMIMRMKRKIMMFGGVGRKKLKRKIKRRWKRKRR